MIGFGTKSETSKNVINYAINAGYTFIDTKDSNHSLKYFNDIDRKNLFLCSKLMSYDHRENISNAFEKSLNEANLNYWNLYYIHTFHSFNNIPILDIYDQLLKLKTMGKIKHVGVSNITYEQLETLLLNREKPDYVQIEIHPYLTEERLVNFCKNNSIKIVAHSPFGSSFCKELLNENILTMLANKYQKTPAQIVLAWHISRGIIPIPSSNNYNNINCNLDGNFKMMQKDCDMIYTLNKNKRCWISPNYYENIGSICKPYKQRIIYNTSQNDKILNDINLKGFYKMTCDNELQLICNNLNNYIKNNKNHVNFSNLYGREYEITYNDKYICSQLEFINKNVTLNEIAQKYLQCEYTTICYFKSSFKTLNLNPARAGLFHRDTQKQKCLKIIIYVSNVTEYNGPLKIVYPENNSEKILWYSNDDVPRTTFDQIITHCGQENINVLIGSKFTCILLEGSAIHSGGYVQIGSRDSIFIEFIKK